jgi:hypothetical protein
MAEAAPIGTSDRYRIERERWSRDRTGTYSPEPDESIEATPLVAAVVALSILWKRDRQVFSVDVMRAVGAVIAATDAIFEVEP